MGNDNNVLDSGTGKAPEYNKSDTVSLISLAQKGIKDKLIRK